MNTANVGFVLYKRGEEPGTLEASWCHPWLGKKTLGTGRATGGPSQGFAGEYRIEYFDSDGKSIAELELRIQKTDTDYYTLEWIEDGKVVDVGVGLEVAEGLAAGWRRIDDTPPPALAELEDAANAGY